MTQVLIELLAATPAVNHGGQDDEVPNNERGNDRRRHYKIYCKLN